MKWLIVAAMCALLGALLLWQHQRERAIADCVAGGGVWNGPRSTCGPAPPRPLLQRDLQRS